MFSRFTIRTRITLGSVIIAAIIFAIALVAARSQVVSILESANGTLAEDDLAYYVDEIVAAPTNLIDDSGKGLLIYIRSPKGVVELNTLPTGIQNSVENYSGSAQRFDVIDGATTFAVAQRIVSTSAGDWTLWAARSTAAGNLALRGL
ncbi:MAG: sensor histidine kinase, partial [Microbacteriaceae bacterium]|nr:sensor histidine kinase [Microbacteriaceae bacterium]